MKMLKAVAVLALSAASLSAVAMTNADGAPLSLDLKQIAPQGPECIKPWSFDQPPFGRCADR